MAGKTLLRGNTIRVTKLDSCGRPLPGPASRIVTRGWVSLTIDPQTEAGTETTLRNAAGEICASCRTCDEFTRNNISLVACDVDPCLISLLTGSPLETDYAGEDVGFRQQSGTLCTRFALEMWASTCGPNGEDTCETGAKEWGYVLLPNIQGMRVSGGLEFNENAVTLELSGGFTSGGAQWGSGPNGYNVISVDAANTPGRLTTPMGDDEHMLLRIVRQDPPEVTDGCAALVIDNELDLRLTVNGSADLTTTSPIADPSIVLTLDNADGTGTTVSKATISAYCSGSNELIGTYNALTGEGSLVSGVDSVTAAPAVAANGTISLAAAATGTITIDSAAIAKPEDCSQIRFLATVVHTNVAGDVENESVEAFVTFIP